MSAPPPEPVEPTAVEPVGTKPRRGLQSVTGETFSFADAVGGVRGVVEAVLPGTVFVVVYVISKNLGWSLGAAVAAAFIAVVARLVQRTPVTQAIGGLLGIAVGVFWAWRSGEAQNFYAAGLWTNALYLVGVLVTILVRWPAVGFVVEAIRTGYSAEKAREQSEQGANPFAGLTAWRKDRDLVRRYTLATWLWVGMFALRLAVQLPLFLDNSVGWLGTARLVLGVPLWGLVLWLTWAVVRGAHQDEPAAEDEVVEDQTAEQ